MSEEIHPRDFFNLRIDVEYLQGQNRNIMSAVSTLQDQMKDARSEIQRLRENIKFLLAEKVNHYGEEVAKDDGSF